MNTILRKATVEDSCALARVAEETFRATFGASNTREDMDMHCSINFGSDIQRNEILSTNIVTLLIEQGTELVGYSQLRWDTPPDCLKTSGIPGEIRRLYVIGEFHGRGVAQQLMQASLKEIERRGSAVAWLGVWEKNPRAIAFYKKIGFFEVGEHEFLLGSDLQRDVIMCLPLREDA